MFFSYRLGSFLFISISQNFHKYWNFHGNFGSSIINATISQHLIDHHIDDKFKIKIKKIELIKINRTKLVPNLMTLVTIGIAILLFSTAVQATTTIRPIDDWAGEKIAGWGDPDSGLIIHPHAVDWSDKGMPFNFFSWVYKTVWQCQYKGFIQERVIDEEHTLITIHLHVKEVPFMIFTYTAGYYFWVPPIYKGIMQYNYQCRILFNTASLYNILEATGKIPSLFEIYIPYFWYLSYPEEPIPVVTYMHIIGEGYLTDGGEGTVEVNQVGILNPGTGNFMWPAEIVIIE